MRPNEGMQRTELREAADLGRSALMLDTHAGAEADNARLPNL